MTRTEEVSGRGRSGQGYGRQGEVIEVKRPDGGVETFAAWASDVHRRWRRGRSGRSWIASKATASAQACAGRIDGLR